MDHEPDDAADTGGTADPPVEFGNALQWSEVDEDEERRYADHPDRVRRVRLLVGACITGGLVIVALTVVGVRVLVSDLNSRDRSKVDVIGGQYDSRYHSCVDGGATAAACAERTARACVNDARWSEDETQRILQACDFTPKAR